MKLRLLFSIFSSILLLNIYAQVNTVGLIGPATPGGWDVDTTMIRDAVDTNMWTLDILLVDGEAKFRANDDWVINWGDTRFPIGIGTANGPNIPARGGMTHVTFNSATGAYYFSVVSDIGILGSATPFAWDADVNMYQSDVDTNEYSLNLELGVGEAKFRFNDDWAINWGATDFPSGVGTQNGPNIPIAVASDYAITFNKSTGAYNFTNIGYSTVGMIGDATSGGWDTPTAMTSVGPKQWEFAGVFSGGGLQFSGDDGVAIWGGSDFPTGTASLDGDTIPVPEGRYLVRFNHETLAYEFVEVVYYDVVGIIGDATPGGWDLDTDMGPNPIGDSSEWFLRVILTDGELKFRANHDWAVNWGLGPNDVWPNGVAILDGPNIPITAGDYEIYFHSFLGNYGFVEKRVYTGVGLIGPATPFGDWATDFQMTKDANDENVWKIPLVELTDGFAKFRAEGAWLVNWGSTSWPSGIGTQDGPDIPIVVGVYGVILNAETGEYAFGDPLTSTKDLLDPASINVWPNPASDNLQVDLSAIDIQGDVTFNVYELTGKLVLSQVKLADTQMQVNISTLRSGHYMLQISNDRYTIGKKFVVQK